jgi:predicted AlkP superfamily pyrophosphatase or phosphodiesterase
MKKSNLWMALTVLVLAFCACTPKNAPIKNPAKHVILIGFDGMSANSLKNGAKMPNYRALMRKGAYTLKNRVVLPSSSACNWASMFMGAGPEQHGFNTWGSKKPDFPSQELTENGFFPDIFYLLRLANPTIETGYFYEWDGMRYLVDTLAISRVQQVALSGKDTSTSLQPIVSYLKEKCPSFCAIIFAEPDGAGHSKGWESEAYYRKLTHLDEALPLILKAVKEAGIWDETLFVLSADHGGKGYGHGGPTLDEMETPVVFYGKGIKEGFQIKQPTMIYDIPATIGAILGIQQPDVWRGKALYSIFKR